MFYYRIFNPLENTNNKSNTGWRSTHAPLLRALFIRSPDRWARWSRGKPLHYSDDNDSPVKNRFNTTQIITTKSFLARLMARAGLMGRMYPTTLLLNSNITPLDQTGRQLLADNPVGQFYLKPDDGYAGHGIQLVRRPRDSLKNKMFTTPYVLQKGVTDLILYQDSRKFEYRVWILFYWNTDSTVSYYYRDAVMRLSATPFNPDSLSVKGNVTTSSHYYGDAGYKSDILSGQPYFDHLWSGTIDLCRTVVNLLRPYIRPVGKKGFEIMGFDFLPTPSGPVLIEINRNIGYYVWPRGVHAPCVVELNKQMIRDLVHLVFPVPEEPEQKGWEIFREEKQLTE
jgi:hypothetical protein